MTPRFVIGIDLGTTNSSLAYIDLQAADVGEPYLLPLAQWENEEQVVEDYRLPSFLWLLPKSLLKKGLWPHPSFPEHKTPWVIGRLARSKALSEPLQVVHSAKSWASTGTVAHRLSKILPWGSEGEKLTPLEVQTALLDHIKRVWDVHFPASPFTQQRVVITVPASFDEVAQRLTLEAAKGADYPPGVELLEEPLAAYYDSEARKQTTDGRILVCDVGGGTSDFTLLLKKPEGTERIMVSEHLLLGGDNIDLALAHHLSARLHSDELPRDAWNLLLAQVRRLKESALNSSAEESFHLSIPLSARNLFGASLSAEVSSAEIRQWVLDDFFPLVDKNDKPARATGLKNWGLPYAKDTAITRHLAEFLQGSEVDAILSVGGSLLPQVLQERLADVIKTWQKAPVLTLKAAEPELAVAYGAARYALLRAQAKELIGSPYPRELLIEVEDNNGIQNLCLIPKNHPRLIAYAVKLPGLNLRLGQDVRFQTCAIGADGSKTPLPPLVLKLNGQGKQDLIPVRLQASVRETGVLEVHCQALETAQVWVLDFAIDSARAQGTVSSALSLNPLPNRDQAVELIRLHFAKQSRGTLKITQLPLALEALFKLGREAWNADQLRGIWAALEGVMFQRGITPEHESIWFYLAGFCLRPGFGYVGDEERMSSILRIYDESFRRVDGNARLLTHWWILWRRLAGGLNPAMQQKLFDRYVPVLRKDKDASPELIRLLASLECLGTSAKEQLGRLLLNQLKEAPKIHSETKLWGLARLYVLAPRVVENWFDELHQLQLPDQTRSAVFYAWGGRMRGDKQYDIDPAYRQKFLAKVDHPEWRKAMTEVMSPDFGMQSQMLADSLPSGFVFRS